MMVLNELCSINAVSGKENIMAEYLCCVAKDIGCECKTDNHGNVIMSVNNHSNKTILLDAHMDQIGLIVKDIDDSGFVKFIPAGGIDASILPATEVVVHGKKDLYGVIGTRPLSMMHSDKGIKIDDFFIDCGMSADNIRDIVKIGDTCSFISDYTPLKNDYISSKSLDNRVGVKVVIDCLKNLVGKKMPYNIVGLFSAGEENGCVPAGLAAENIKPDYAIVVDVTFGKTPTTDIEQSFATGEGITVGVGPSLDRILSERFIEQCKKKDIPFSKEICNSNPGTNSWSIQLAGDGVKCLLVSVPIKYMHSTVETVNLKDIQTAVYSICAALEGGVFDA